jgi:hypothetical protein
VNEFSKLQPEDIIIPTPQDILSWAVAEFMKQHPNAIITGFEVVNGEDGPKIVFEAIEPRSS